MWHRIRLQILAVALVVASVSVVGRSATASAQAAASAGTPGAWAEGVECLDDATQTYSLYLPSNYDPHHTWPALMVFDPRGRSVAAGRIFQRGAEEFGWIIVSSNDTRSDESWDPNSKALRALWPEVHSRYRIDPQRIYGAGFSGGVIIAWYLAQLADKPTLAGILGAGGRPAQEIPVDDIAFAHFGTAGVFDFNYLPMKALDALLAKHESDHQLQFFSGRHQWMPEPLAYEGMQWMEVLAMRDALRSADGAFLERTYRQYRHLADSLLAAGQDLEALRRYQLVASSWRGLRDLRALQKRVDRLENSDTVGKQRDREIETDRWESDRQQEFLPWLGALEEGVNDLDWQELVEELKLEDLQKDAQERTARGNAAQRVLEWTFARTSFYIQRRLLAVGNPSQAAVSLRIAAFIHPHLWHVWYNLACAHALAGENEAANDALSRAVDGGFDNLAHLENDADLATLRGTREFREIVARLR